MSSKPISNTRLHTLLRQLSPAEWRSLEKMVLSPYFNTNEKLIELCRHLQSCYLEIRVIPSRESIHRRLFPGESYQDLRVRQLLSYLHRLGLRMLAISEWEANPQQEKQALSAAVRKKRLDKHFQRNQQAIKKELTEQPFRHAEFYSRLYAWEQEEYQFRAGRQRHKELNLQAVSDNLDVYYLAEKLRQSCYMLSHQAVYKEKYQLGLLEALLDQLSWEDFLSYPAIRIYYYAFRSLSSPEDNRWFPLLKKELLENTSLFPEKEVRDLYLLAINYCIRRYNQGDPVYLKDELELYQAGLEKEIFLQDGVLSRFTYLNITTLAIATGDLDWLETFISKYRHFLGPEHRESVFCLASARLAYRRDQHGKALQLLQKAFFKDTLLNLSAKMLMLKIYYETQEFDVLSAHLDAMRMFLHRKKLLAYHRQNYLATLRFVQKALELPPGDRAARTTLRAELEKTENLAEKAWLLEMIA
jgi:hypothetical protein